MVFDLNAYSNAHFLNAIQIIFEIITMVSSTAVDKIRLYSSRKTSSASKETSSSSKKSLKIDKSQLLNYRLDTLPEPPNLKQYLEYSSFEFEGPVLAGSTNQKVLSLSQTI